MDILSPIKSGFKRSLKCWKGVFINWILTFFIVIMIAFPLRGAINSILGSSMITDKLSKGIIFDVIPDLGSNFKTLISMITSGFFIVLLSGFLLNVFITGGLFSNLKRKEGRFSYSVFFNGSIYKFWSFLVIMLIMSLIILISGFIVIGIPIIIASGSGSIDGARLRAFMRFGSLFLLLLPIFLLITDYARAWLVMNEKGGCFKAIGFGFSHTFRTFLSSYPVMVILLISQSLFGWIILKILPGMTPASSGGIFLFFLLSQFLFFTRILLKVWRYGSVTALLEMKMKKEVDIEGFQS
jgi:hypothetical protein